MNIKELTEQDTKQAEIIAIRLNQMQIYYYDVDNNYYVKFDNNNNTFKQIDIYKEIAELKIYNQIYTDTIKQKIKENINKINNTKEYNNYINRLNNFTKYNFSANNVISAIKKHKRKKTKYAKTEAEKIAIKIANKKIIKTNKGYYTFNKKDKTFKRLGSYKQLKDYYINNISNTKSFFVETLQNKKKFIKTINENCIYLNQRDIYKYMIQRNNLNSLINEYNKIKSIFETLNENNINIMNITETEIYKFCKM